MWITVETCCIPAVNLVVERPTELLSGAFGYDVIVERYDPVTQTAVEYDRFPRRQLADFPITITGVPTGFYRSIVYAALPGTLVPVGSTLYRFGQPGKIWK